MKSELIEKNIAENEKNKTYGEFVDVESNRQYEEPDENFKYLHYGFFMSIVGFISRCLIKILSPLLMLVIYRARYVNKKELKKVKNQGFILIGNHTRVLDCGLSYVAVWSKRYYAVSASINNFKNFGGKFLSSVGSLPLSTKLSAKKNLNKAISACIKKKAVVTIYPERAMWPNYKKIRPFNRGAFYFAVKNNCPILPIITLYRNPNKFEKLFHLKANVTIKYLSPIWPNKQLSERDNIKYMQQKAQWLYNQEYTNYYGKTDYLINVGNPDLETNKI